MIWITVLRRLHAVGATRYVSMSLTPLHILFSAMSGTRYHCTSPLRHR